MTKRILFYVQHLFGIGHLRRACLITEALQQQNHDITLISGGSSVPHMMQHIQQFIQLPAIKIRGTDYHTLLDDQDNPVDQTLLNSRTEQLLKQLDIIQPSVLIIETFPFGRRMLKHELMPLLMKAKQLKPNPIVACSIRDIPEPKKKPSRNQEIVNTIQEYFDYVLVHSDKSLCPFQLGFSDSVQIKDKLIYTGFVAPVIKTTQQPRQREILVSAGGGASGMRLLECAIAAQKHLALPDTTWRLIAGPKLSDADYQILARQINQHIILEQVCENYIEQLSKAALSISRGGYNTIVELLITGTKSIIIPFMGPQHDIEQVLRANALAKLGLTHVISDDDLNPQDLAQLIAQVLTKSAPNTHHINLNGLEKTCQIINNWLH